MRTVIKLRTIVNQSLVQGCLFSDPVTRQTADADQQSALARYTRRLKKEIEKNIHFLSVSAVISGQIRAAASRVATRVVAW